MRSWFPLQRKAKYISLDHSRKYILNFTKQSSVCKMLPKTMVTIHFSMVISIYRRKIRILVSKKLRNLKDIKSYVRLTKISQTSFYGDFIWGWLLWTEHDKESWDKKEYVFGFQVSGAWGIYKHHRWWLMGCVKGEVIRPRLTHWCRNYMVAILHLNAIFLNYIFYFPSSFTEIFPDNLIDNQSLSVKAMACAKRTTLPGPMMTHFQWRKYASPVLKELFYFWIHAINNHLKLIIL